jgi:hypothetical protein
VFIQVVFNPTMSNTTSSAVPESFHDLITTLGGFQKNSGSTSSANNMSAAFASIPHVHFPPTKLLQHTVRQRLADVIEGYKDSFNQHKHLITNFPTIQSRKRKGEPGSGE